MRRHQSQVFNQTQYVTIFDLPPGLLVEIVFVPKWKVKVITKFVTIIIDRICPPIPRPIPDPKPPRYHPWPTFNPSPTKSGDPGTKPASRSTCRRGLMAATASPASA
jgi:hypothetical protein